jgi:hypothetical protein
MAAAAPKNVKHRRHESDTSSSVSDEETDSSEGADSDVEDVDVNLLAIGKWLNSLPLQTQLAARTALLALVCSCQFRAPIISLTPPPKA